jgi:hypothetical protein
MFKSPTFVFECADFFLNLISDVPCDCGRFIGARLINLVDL